MSKGDSGLYSSVAGEASSSRAERSIDQKMDSLEEYQGHGYKDLNKKLRLDKRLNPAEEQMAEDLDALAKPAEEDISVFRTVTETERERLGMDTMTLGTVFRDNGFASTSRDEMVAARFHPLSYEVHIDIPKGTPVIDFADAFRESGRRNDLREEKEVLLPRGTMFKVGQQPLFKESRPMGNSPYTRDLYVTVVKNPDEDVTTYKG